MRREAIGDVVVVIPGIMGSTLTRDDRDVWNVSASAGWRALRSRLGSLAELRLPEGIGDRHPDDGVRPGGLMGALHVVPGLWSPVVGYHGLVDWLRREFTLTAYEPSAPDRPANLFEFPYDWRLSNRFNGARLAAEVMPVLHLWRREKNPQAKLILLAHSMGGLVARHFLECCHGAVDTRLLITLGTPYRGSLAALVTVVNGLPGGRLGAGLTGLARSLPSMYELAPAYACLTGADGLRYPLETELPLTAAQLGMLADGAAFHEEVNASARRRQPPWYAVPMQGTRQPTPTTAALTGAGRLVTYTTIDGYAEGGDGRVARLSGRPVELSEADPAQAGYPDRGLSGRPRRIAGQRGHPPADLAGAHREAAVPPGASGRRRAGGGRPGDRRTRRRLPGRGDRTGDGRRAGGPGHAPAGGRSTRCPGPQPDIGQPGPGPVRHDVRGAGRGPVRADRAGGRRRPPGDPSRAGVG